MPKTTEKLFDKVQAARRGNDYTRRDFDAGVELATALAKALNGGDRNNLVLGLTEGLTREHRYLQGEAVFALLKALGNLGSLADSSRHTDARNVHAYRACAKIREALRDQIIFDDE
jgi:hypothetical protein